MPHIEPHELRIVQATELRIGNWLSVSGGTINTYQTFKPRKVDIDFLVAIEKENKERPDAMLSWFAPIPLTPYILEKAGAEYDGIGIYKIDKNIKWSLGVLSIANGAHFIKCEYVHTFQNAIYSLTGTDLTINL